VRVQELLKGKNPDTYLIYKGPPKPEPPGSADRLLQDLGDQYYHLMLDVLRMAFHQPESVRGRTLRQARRVMLNLHEVGRLLNKRRKALLFTMAPAPPSGGASGSSAAPSSGGGPGGVPSGAPGGAPGGSVSVTLGVSIPGLLVSLSAFGSADVADVARRHAQTMSELTPILEDNGEEEEP
jgi:hypothetical protein